MNLMFLSTVQAIYQSYGYKALMWEVYYQFLAETRHVGTFLPHGSINQPWVSNFLPGYLCRRGIYTLLKGKKERTVVPFLLHSEGDSPSGCRGGSTTLVVMLERMKAGNQNPLMQMWMRMLEFCSTGLRLAPQRDTCAVFWTKVIFWVSVTAPI